MARQEILPDGTIITLERYAQLSGEVSDPVRTVLRVIEAEADPDGTNGEWVLCGDAGPDFTTADNGLTFVAPVVVAPVVPQHATKRAFQNRFPTLANGVSTKWDAMCLFLSDDGYAASLGVSGAALYGLRMLITTGVQRLNASPFVDMDPSAEAAGLTALLMNASIPADFRLTAGERETMLDTPLADGERFKG